MALRCEIVSPKEAVVGAIVMTVRDSGTAGEGPSPPTPRKGRGEKISRDAATGGLRELVTIYPVVNSLSRPNRRGTFDRQRVLSQ
jgi:hypothetical protein